MTIWVIFIFIIIDYLYNIILFGSIIVIVFVIIFIIYINDTFNCLPYPLKPSQFICAYTLPASPLESSFSIEDTLPSVLLIASYSLLNSLISVLNRAIYEASNYTLVMIVTYAVTISVNLDNALVTIGYILSSSAVI